MQSRKLRKTRQVDRGTGAQSRTRPCRSGRFAGPPQPLDSILVRRPRGLGQTGCHESTRRTAASVPLRCPQIARICGSYEAPILPTFRGVLLAKQFFQDVRPFVALFADDDVVLLGAPALFAELLGEMEGG